MVPEEVEQPPTDEKNDVMLAGYRECATEALNWLLGLGYQPGHPLIRSLAAHLTKKQAYLEKLSLEKFLIDETMENSGEDFKENTQEDMNNYHSKYKSYHTYHILNNKDIQKSLVNAVFRGCDLRYK